MSRQWIDYLADEGKNEVVDGDITIQGKCEANEKDQVMCQNRWEPAAV